MTRLREGSYHWHQAKTLPLIVSSDLQGFLMEIYQKDSLVFYISYKYLHMKGYKVKLPKISELDMNMFGSARIYEYQPPPPPNYRACYSPGLL